MPAYITLLVLCLFTLLIVIGQTFQSLSKDHDHALPAHHYQQHQHSVISRANKDIYGYNDDGSENYIGIDDSINIHSSLPATSTSLTGRTLT